MITVSILDDHPMIIEGLKNMLSPESDIQIIGEFIDKQNCLTFFEKELPNVLLLDINLKKSNGIEICAYLTKTYPRLKVIGLSNYNEPGFIKNMLRNGARGYLLKNTSKAELIEAIKTVMENKNFLPRSVETILLNDSIGTPNLNHSIPKLTRREKEVLKHISDEMTNAEIADKLFISIKTVESHRTNLLQKFNAKNTAGLIKAAMNAGLIS